MKNNFANIFTFQESGKTSLVKKLHNHDWKLEQKDNSGFHCCLEIKIVPDKSRKDIPILLYDTVIIKC